jgi:hypothetical protein
MPEASPPPSLPVTNKYPPRARSARLPPRWTLDCEGVSSPEAAPGRPQGDLQMHEQPQQASAPGLAARFRWVALYGGQRALYGGDVLGECWPWTRQG